MKRFAGIFLTALFCLLIQVAVPAQQQEIAVVGQNATAVPNSDLAYDPLTGNYTFAIFTNPPNSYVKSKFTGVHNGNCTFALGITGQMSNYTYNAASGTFSFVIMMPVAGPPGIFTLNNNPSGQNLLQGFFTSVVVHGTNGSHAMAVTVPDSSVTYQFPSLLLSNNGYMPPVVNGSLSVSIITVDPVSAGPLGLNMNNLPIAAFANANFGAP